MHAPEQGGVYRVSLSIVGMVDVFIYTLYASIALDSLAFYQSHEQLEVFAYGVPSSLNLVVRVVREIAPYFGTF